MKVLSYENENLEVHLLNGKSCTYFDVPFKVYDEMVKSESPLDYFNSNIWGCKYEHEMEWSSLEDLLVEIADILLVEPPISVNEQPFNDTPLHVTAIWGDVKATNMLLAAGAGVNTLGDMSCTPLYNAVSFGHVRCAKLLIDAGASLDDENELEISAKEAAMKSGNQYLVKLFESRA